MSDLMVMVPTRGRRKQCERLLKSFEENTSDADLVFVLDDDDVETYEGVDWGGAQHGIIGPRQSLSGKLNTTADAYTGMYKYLMFVGDDHVFKTPKWDTLLLEKFDEMGGAGLVYPDDKRRNDVPEIVAISSDIVRVLGHFAEPALKHYYLDHVWGELGRRAGLIRFAPDIVIEHLHYSVAPETERDATYVETENTWGQSDVAAWHKWRAEDMPVELAKLRRNLNPDLKWIFSKF